MKIAWFTPLHERSAIGQFSVGVTAALVALGIEVELWRSDIGPARPVKLPVHQFTSDGQTVALLASRYDLCVYNFGNYLPYHGSIYEISQQHAGLAILHDLTLHHFFASLYLERMHSPEEYFNALTALYPELRKHYHTPKALAAAQLWGGEEITRYPFFDPVLTNALTAVCHSKFQAAAVTNRWPGPVSVLPLAYEPNATLISNVAEVPHQINQRLRLLVVGHINPNKCVQLLLEALHALPPVDIVCAGPVEEVYRQTLESLCSKVCANSRISFTGQVSDEDLAAQFLVADLCINLRRPITEGASASMIEQMFLGKPSVIFSDGFYGELPAETVFRCTTETLQACLRTAISDPQARLNVSVAAKRYAESTFTYARYALEIRRIISAVMERAPLFRLTTTLGRELKRWNVGPNDRMVQRLSGIIEGLFQPEL